MYLNAITSCSKVVGKRQFLHVSSVFVTKQIQIPFFLKFHSLSHSGLLNSGQTQKIECRTLSGLAKEPAKPSSPLKVIGSAIGISVLLSSLYSYWKLKKENEKVDKFVRGQTRNESSIKDYVLSDPPPYFEPARKIRNTSKDIGIKLTLYQYQTCPFCCKARVFLDYFGFNYDVVEVNSVMRKEVKWSAYKKVPIIVAELADGTVLQLNDSSVIVSALGSFLQDKTASLEKVLACYPKITSIDPSGKEVTELMNKYFIMYLDQEMDTGNRKKIANERKWRQWVDNVLVHTLSPNVYRTPSESLQAFQWFDKVGNWESLFSSWERNLVIYFGAFVMWIIGSRLKKRHQLKSDVRESLYDEINFWLKSIKAQKTPFMGGDSPDLSDLAVFGVLNAIEGCEAFNDVLANTKISSWYDSMREACKNHGGLPVLESKS